MANKVAVGRIFVSPMRCSGTEFWINLGESTLRPNQRFPEWVPAMRSVVSQDDYDAMMRDVKDLFEKKASPWYRSLCCCFSSCILHNFANKLEEGSTWRSDGSKEQHLVWPPAGINIILSVKHELGGQVRAEWPRTSAGSAGSRLDLSGRGELPGSADTSPAATGKGPGGATTSPMAGGSADIVGSADLGEVVLLGKVAGLGSGAKILDSGSLQG
ncbi:hypothetical protein T484DRAFT_1782347 [Baffinella frigidus]|nr:hypothetical protein T484DRAFT_1782347 [Cryptophyta sp. CCMP2293]